LPGPRPWQLDVMGGVFLTDGRELKLISGIDDHSRFIIIAHLVVRASGRAVCRAFAQAMSVFGAPEEVLTDNGKQFTGRFTKPRPTEVLFERDRSWHLDRATVRLVTRVVDRTGAEAAGTGTAIRCWSGFSLRPA